jgi:aminoglycoside 6'-N-acetyltransferase
MGTDSGVARDGDLSIRLMRDERSDYELLSRWLSDDRVLEFYEGRDNPLSVEGAREKYGPRSRGEAAVVSCVLQLEGNPIGYLQFYRTDDFDEWRTLIGLDPDPRRYSIDIFIGEPELWDRGLGTRALRSVLAHLFGERDASAVVITPFAWNERAIRCYEKAGFRKVRLMPQVELHEGKLQDEWLMVVESGRPTEPAARSKKTDAPVGT